MIDNKKKEEAARHNADKYRNCPTLSDEDRDKVSIGSFKDGAKWAINEFLKDLWHSASEEPKNLEFIVFTNDIFGEIYFFTMQRDNSLQSWETEVSYHDIDQWAYRNDIVSLLLKGGKQ